MDGIGRRAAEDWERGDDTGHDMSFYVLRQPWPEAAGTF